MEFTATDVSLILKCVDFVQSNEKFDGKRLYICKDLERCG